MKRELGAMEIGYTGFGMNKMWKAQTIVIIKLVTYLYGHSLQLFACVRVVRVCTQKLRIKTENGQASVSCWQQLRYDNNGNIWKIENNIGF